MALPKVQPPHSKAETLNLQTQVPDPGFQDPSPGGQKRTGLPPQSFSEEGGGQDFSGPPHSKAKALNL